MSQNTPCATWKSRALETTGALNSSMAESNDTTGWCLIAYGGRQDSFRELTHCVARSWEPVSRVIRQ
jgi:hypothetical protein